MSDDLKAVKEIKQRFRCIVRARTKHWGGPEHVTDRLFNLDQIFAVLDGKLEIVLPKQEVSASSSRN